LQVKDIKKLDLEEAQKRAANAGWSHPVVDRKRGGSGLPHDRVWPATNV